MQDVTTADRAPAGAARVRTHCVTAEEAGQRLDNFLMRCWRGLPRTRVYRLIRRGEVRVNRGRSRPDYRLQAGDLVRLPPVRLSPQTHQAHPNASLESRILHEDARLLVLDKPAGLAVHGGSGVRQGVIETLRANRPGEPFLELVHRLDRETSGCLLVARRRSELRRLHALLRTGRIEKAYLALVVGQWQGGARWIEAPLARNRLQGGERVVRVDPAGRPARSLFEPIARCEGYTLMRVTLDTGRTHQIRVHAAHAGHPLAGDEKYGDREANRRLREAGLRRLFLHAHRLAFDRADGGRLLVEAPLDPALEKVLVHLGCERHRTDEDTTGKHGS